MTTATAQVAFGWPEGAVNVEVTVGNEVSAADGALARGAKIVSESKVALTGEISSIEGKLASIGSSWQGQSATAFVGLMERWRVYAKKITDNLDAFEQNLIASQSTYTAADDVSTAGLNRLQSRLG